MESIQWAPSLCISGCMFFGATKGSRLGRDLDPGSTGLKAGFFTDVYFAPSGLSLILVNCILFKGEGRGMISRLVLSQISFPTEPDAQQPLPSFHHQDPSMFWPLNSWGFCIAGNLDL